jgi:hypothetical protein
MTYVTWQSDLPHIQQNKIANQDKIKATKKCTSRAQVLSPGNLPIRTHLQAPYSPMHWSVLLTQKQRSRETKPGRMTGSASLELVTFTCTSTLTRVNSANVPAERLRIGGRGRWMNSKVKIKQTRRILTCIKNKRSTQLAQSQSIPGRPLLAPLYRWPGLKEPVEFNTNYNVYIRCHLVFRQHHNLGLF